MKVLKFGGTSVGSTASLRNVKDIVSGREESEIVVVSALGGITDQLIKASTQAAAGDHSYLETYANIQKRHMDMIDELFPDTTQAAGIKKEINLLLARLGDILHGVCLLQTLTDSISCEIVSFGERMSCRIAAALLGASLHDSLELIKTTDKNGKNVPDFQITTPLIQKEFEGFDKDCKVAVMPGFISTDRDSGKITNLGRGGSDYTASILAAILNARVLEIWTDVDGFMTADPRIISTSYVIKELSYREAMELCNFGAKVIYPPTLYPVRAKRIPILVKNTFNPAAPGTIITEDCTSTKSITGISSIDNTCLLTLSGNSMVGIIGVDGRIFSTLADNNISIFMISQSSSETGISIGVGACDAQKARMLLEDEFKHEIEMGSINHIKMSENLATVAVVGDNMKNNAGLAGKLFTTLGRNGISVIACAQGSDETNISFVVESRFLRKSLNVIHDSFFLSECQELNVFVCGVGTVGSKLIEQIASQQETLRKERNLKINIVGIARSSTGIFNRNGIDLANWKEELKNGIKLTPALLRDEIISMNIFNSVFVDCTASAEVAGLYMNFFEHGISVVAANKIAASSDYGNYLQLKDCSRQRNVKYLFETNVGAGLPIINTINALVNSGDRIQKIEAVLSGTLNFIFNTLSEDIPFSKAVKMAQEQGYSEPDPRIDLSGKDVIRKLVILSREAGYTINQEDVQANLFIPEEFFKCSMEEFWQKLPSLDAEFEAKRKQMQQEDKRFRFVARMDNGKGSVALESVEHDHSFYVLDGSNNIVLLTTQRYHEHPMLIQGYGAGADVTAAGVFADIMSIANI